MGKEDLTYDSFHAYAMSCGIVNEVEIKLRYRLYLAYTLGDQDWIDKETNSFNYNIEYYLEGKLN